MASVVIAGDTSGSITLSAPAVAGSNTLSLPASTGTVLTSASPASDLPSSIKGPAFSAYQSSAQSVSGATTTKVQFQTELFDTANCFDSTTNYRFTPNVAGYYQLNCAISVGGAAQVQACHFYKNGSIVANGIDASATQSTNSTLVYLNGSTDYVEVYVFSLNAKTLDALATRTYFSGSMVRAA